MPGDNNYRSALEQAFPFFRRFSQGRYSSQSLMRLARAVDEYDGYGSSAGNLPLFLIASTPFSYDEETEVKSGGTLAMLAYWPSQDGRTMLAIAPPHRGKRLGTSMVACLRDYINSEVTLWVGRTNTLGHRLALTSGLFPTAISPSGAVRYATAMLDADGDGGGEEDYNAVARPARRPRRPASVQVGEPILTSSTSW